MKKPINKIELLKILYALFDQVADSWEIACKRTCSDCCTDRIWMTTIEGKLITEYIQSENMQNLYEKMNDIPINDRCHPKTTTNQEAILSVQDKPIPVPENHDIYNTCPFLSEHVCPIYPVRPMACRSMVSKTPCSEKGFAEMSPIAMSVSTVFSQYIEHIDSNGYYGNFMNILTLLTTPEESMPIQHVMAQGLSLKNIPMKYLMVPPEHRLQIQPILEKIHSMGGA